MLLKRSTGFVFGYQILKHFLKSGPILPGENRKCRISAVFKSQEGLA